MTVFVVALLSAMVMGMLQINVEEIRIMHNQIRAAEALAVAEAGLNDALAESNKCLLKINGKPAIEYSLEYAEKTDVDEIIIVVGYLAEDIINEYGHQFKTKPVKYVLQWEQKGLVHAIESAKTALAGDDFLLMLGDEILLKPRHQEMIDSFKKQKAFALCGILYAQDTRYIQRNYTMIQNHDNKISRLIEKPRKPLNALMGTGNCIFKNEILNYIQFTPVHYERNEKELPDLIQCAIDDGMMIKSFEICERYMNINTKEDIAIAESFFQ